MIVKFKRGLQRWPAGRLGSWLKLLMKLDRLTGDDLYRIRAVILFQQQRSGLFGDEEWEWPADDGTGRNPIALLSLLFVARRQGDVRLQLYKEGDDQPLLLRSFIEKRVQELLLEIDLRMEGEEESLKWLRDDAKSLLELLVSDFAEGDKKNLSSSLVETVWKMVAHWERSAVMEWCQHFPLDYSDAEWSGLFPEEKTLFSLDRNSLYFHRFLMAEKSVAQKLGERLKKERLHPVDKVEAAFDALPQSRTLHPNQRAAVLECSSRQTTVVTGGPGTGKTTVVAQILRTLMALNRRVNQVRRLLGMPYWSLSKMAKHKVKKYNIKIFPFKSDILNFLPIPATITTGNSSPLLLCILIILTTFSFSPKIFALLMSPLLVFNLSTNFIKLNKPL